MRYRILQNPRSLFDATLDLVFKLAEALSLKINIRLEEKLPKGISIVAQNSATATYEIKY